MNTTTQHDIHDNNNNQETPIQSPIHSNSSSTNNSANSSPTQSRHSTSQNGFAARFSQRLQRLRASYKSDSKGLSELMEQLYSTSKLTAKQQEMYSRSQSILRWPILLIVLIVLLLEFIGYLIVRFVARWIWEEVIVGLVLSSFMTKYRKSKSLRKVLQEAKDYERWKHVALELDTLYDINSWKEYPGSSLFDHPTLYKATKQLEEAISSKDTNKIAQSMQMCVKANFAGIENDKLYKRCFFGTKYVIEDYTHQVLRGLDYIYSANVDRRVKRKFYKQLMRAYGRTALCLSGGATMALVHFGVVKVLLEQKVLPKVISGTSAGALIASMVCVRTDAELKEVLHPKIYEKLNMNDEPFYVVLKRLITAGSLFDQKRLREKVEFFTKGTTTFLEAFEKTGRILNITVTATDKNVPELLLNYITAPHVVISSAVLASASLPIMLCPQQLMMKDPSTSQLEPFHAQGKHWRDGSFKIDIPLKALQQFSVTYTIVSQANPHISFFFYEHRGTGEHRHRGLRGGFILTSLEQLLKLDMMKWLRFLRNLDLLPSVIGQDGSFLFLQKFHGNCSIIPKAGAVHYLKMFSNPSQHTMEQYFDIGQRSAWPKICQIRNRLIVEQALEHYYHLLKQLGKKEQKLPIGSQASNHTSSRFMATM